MKKQREIILILDNLRSEYNVGSLFRTADGAGVKQIVLIGTTPTPLDRFGRVVGTIAKTALGAETVISWSHYKTLSPVIKMLRKNGYTIFALEQSSSSILHTKIPRDIPCALIVGNEVDGISPKVLSLCDEVIEIPMHGIKESLNVSVAGAIALYELIK